MRVLWLLVPLLVVGCQSDNSYEIVRERASEDLRCPREQIIVRYQGAGVSTCPVGDVTCRDREESTVSLLAQGCGAFRTYTCTSHRDTTFGNTHSTCRASGESRSM